MGEGEESSEGEALDVDAADGTAGAVAAVYAPIDSLRPWKGNPRWKDRKKFKKAVRLLMKSIRRFGFGAPMLARLANNEIIAGHTRWAAAKRLGHKTVPVRFMDLSEDEAHAHAIGDNKTAEYGEWHDDKLQAALRELESHDVNLTDGIGFGDDELDEIMVADDDEFDMDDDGMSGGGKGGSGHLKYRILVECTGEEDQSILLTQLESMGRSCKPLMS
jgi:site-specific DNA-methyltransferase (adenine-specific)